MGLAIEQVLAREILDSRGRPTISVTVTLRGAIRATAQVPSGASAGRWEAWELRDGDRARYGGYGVLSAVANVNREIADAVRGWDAQDQHGLDTLLIGLDGTPNKSRLGANAILGVSCACARAAAMAQGVPLWCWLAQLAGCSEQVSMPLPMVNILSGGLHAGGQIEFQDFLAIPAGACDFAQALEMVSAIHRSTREILEEKKYRLTGVADEGGWGPRLSSNREAVDILISAIERSGYRPGSQVAIGVDVAASHFHAGGKYRLESEGRELTSAELAEMLCDWCQEAPVVSIEDALDQDDWQGWAELNRKWQSRANGSAVQWIGDDLFVTNPERVQRGIAENAANAVLVKMNQIGTLTETFEVLRMARRAGWRAVVSARSGETEDSFLADLAVGSGAGQIKVGSVTRSERLAKYNRLLEIEGENRLALARPFVIP